MQLHRLFPKLGAIGLIVAWVTLLSFSGVAYGQRGGPEPPMNREAPFRINEAHWLPSRAYQAEAQASTALPAGQAKYDIRMLAPAPGYEGSRAHGIDAAGNVVGRFSNMDEVSGLESDRQAFYWETSSGAVILPTLSGETSAWAVNSNGMVSGFSINSSAKQHAARWNTGTSAIMDLGTLANANEAHGDQSTAYGINEGDDVVGLSDIPSVPPPGEDPFMPYHAFLYTTAGGLQDLGTLTTDYPDWQNGYSIAYAINGDDEVVGIANTVTDDWYFYPFIYDESNGMQQLNIDPAYPAGEWYAVAINDNGLIGGHVIAAHNQSLPYYWTSSGADPAAVTLPTEFPYGEIYGINSDGQMVGIMWDSDADIGATEHAFAFDSVNGAQDLNALIESGAGWVLNFARDINDSGQIVGMGTYLGQRRGFVLTERDLWDVGADYWAHEWIEALYASGITSGCSVDPPLYCPEDPVSRAQMAIFLERGMRGAEYNPPSATGSVFNDVPSDHWAAAWIEQLAADGITAGCSTDPPLYCPEATASRAQMAVFIERAMHWPDPYSPPSASGTVFADVPVNHWAANWIEQLYEDGITSGCAQDPLRYCPESSVTRAQIALFLVRAFELPMP